MVGVIRVAGIAMKWRSLGAVLILLALSNPAAAPFFTPSNAEIEDSMQRQFDSISQHFLLSDTDSAVAKRTAATWIYVGPCEGPDRPPLAKDQGYDAIAMIAAGSPYYPLRDAVAEMIVAMEAESLGRKPPQIICDLALKMARPAGQ
jgi:hypothetical protein